MRRLLWIVFVTVGFTGPGLSYAADGVREVQYDRNGLISIQARLLIATTIVLPDDETILDYICGDKDFWIINGTANMAHVKPAKAGIWTNLNLVASSGRIYTFRLQEGSNAPDLKVFVTAPAGAPSDVKRYYTSGEIDALRTQLAETQASVAAAKRGALEAIEAQRADYPTRLRFDYAFKRNKKPFDVSEIWHDGAATFIRSTARELPALFEEKEGEAVLVNYQVQDGGTYVVRKVLERGYLLLGNKKLTFRLTTH